MGAVTLQIRSLLRVRSGSPSSTAPIVGHLQPGAIVTALGEISGEAVSGNALWYQLDGQRFIWSGGAVPAAPGVHAPDTSMLPVATYPDGRIEVLDDAGIRAVYGNFSFSEGSPRGAISMDPAWVRQNITDIEVPMFAAIGHPKLWVNVHAAEPFKRVFAAIEAAGIGDRILTCGGTFVPRHKNWNPVRSLSSHSWGIAIDLNVAWNGYGVKPPPVGAIGSNREFIPFFAAEGFGWGGDFTEPDGMHFELALKRI